MSVRARRSVLPILLLASALVATPQLAGPAVAVPATLCSSLGAVGPITSEGAFNDAIDEVNAGHCEEIDVSGVIAFTAAPTVLHPPNSVSMVTISGSTGAVLDGKDGASAAVHGLLVEFGDPAHQALELTNLTLKEFEGTATVDEAWRGGALYLPYGGALTIADSTLTDNHALGGATGQGGVVDSWGPISLVNSAFVGNTATGNGGVAFSFGPVTISGSTFTGNLAGAGGGAVFAGDTATASIEDSTFTENRAAGHGGATPDGGGGGGAVSSAGTITSLRASYQGNAAETDGGALMSSADLSSTLDVFISNDASATLSNGGAVALGGIFEAHGTRFEENHAGFKGGAVSARACHDTDSVFARNVSENWGGAMSCIGGAQDEVILDGTVFRANESTGDSGGALWTNVNVDATGVTFDGNSSVAGGGAVSAYPPTELAFADTDFVDNSTQSGGGAIFAPSATTIRLTGGELRSNTAGGDGGAIVTGGSVTAEDTLFAANRAAGVFNLGTEGGGAIAATGSVSVTRATFDGNVTVNYGGGAVRTASTFTSLDSTFTNNSQDATGTYHGPGGAVFADATVTVTGSVFDGNTSLNVGGGFSTLGNADVEDSTLTGNTATGDGGGANVGGALIISNSLVEGNAATGDGGGFRVGSSATVTGSTFDDNQGNTGGGLSALNATITGSTFHANSAVNGGGVSAGFSLNMVNSTFDSNTATIFGSALYLPNVTTSAVVRFSTLISPATGTFPYGSVITYNSGTQSVPLTLIGTVVSGPWPVCGLYWLYSPGDPYLALHISGDSRSSFTTDVSCDSPTPGAVSVASLSALQLDGPITTDPTPGMQVVVPGATSVLNDVAPVSLLPSGVTTDQLGALRDSADGLTSVGAVQVRDTVISGPSSQSVAEGADASFAVAAVPGVGTTATYQWQSSPDGVTWSDITSNASALTPTLTLTSVSVLSSGLRVRAQVTDLGGVTSSNSATLIVSGPPGPGPSPSPSPATPSAAPTTTPAPAEPTTAPAPTATPAPTAPARLNVVLVGSREGSKVVVDGSFRKARVTSVRPMVKVAGHRKYVEGKRIPVGRDGRFTWHFRTDRAVSVYFTAGRARSSVVRIGANR